MNKREMAAASGELISQIRPMLAGRPAELQGFVLAELLAIFLAGHHVEGDADATRGLRAELMAAHCSAARQLVPAYARDIGTTP